MSSSWRQIRTPDLRVIGTARQGELRDVLSALETFRAAFARLFPNARLNGPVPTSIVVLENYDAFRRYQPRDSRGRRMANVGGYFSSTADANYMVFPYQGNSSYELIFHEYAHYLVHQNTRVFVPMWLNEGLAEFYSTFQPNYQGRGLVGAPPSARVQTLRERTYLPVRDLVSPKDMEKMWRSGPIEQFYAESWALVHYIMVGRKNPVEEPIPVYLATLAATDSQDQAFRAAFGVDLAAMDRELREYMRRFTFQALVVPRAVRSDNELVVEPVAEMDARHFQAALLALQDDVEEAEKEVQRALALDPAHVGARITQARLRLRDDKDAEAIATLTEVAAAAPREMAAHYYLGAALAKTWRHEEAVAAFTRATSASPANPYAWLGLSGATLALGRDSQAAATFQAAMQLEANPGFHSGYAHTALGLGKDETAAANVRKYLDNVSLAEQSGQYAAFIGVIANMRLGRADDVRTLLADTAAAVRSSTWQETVVRYLAGKLDADAFLAKADGIGEQTEAHAYIGLKLGAAGQREDALTHFEWVASKGLRTYSEYGIAKAELRRLLRPVVPEQPVMNKTP
jgi:tetratricopeptide (TPR) repeat protein